MRFAQPFINKFAAVAAGALVVSLALPIIAAQAAPKKTYLMKISTPTLHDIPNAWIAGYAKMLEKDSDGRIKVKIYPASQLGSIGQQIQGTQFGSIQCLVVPPVFMVGVDPRFQVLAAPDLVRSEAQGPRIAQDPAVLKLMLRLGANKGLHGVGLFYAQRNVIISRMPLRKLSDFKGKKIRVFASPFETKAFERLGMTPVSMGLANVVPALQEGTIDGAILGVTPAVNFHMVDAAKYVTKINQPAIFIIAEVNKKWYRSLPGDLRHLIDKDGAREDTAMVPIAAKLNMSGFNRWKSAGGTLIKLPAAEHAQIQKKLSSVGAEVSKSNPKLATAYKIVAAASKHTESASTN